MGADGSGHGRLFGRSILVVEDEYFIADHLMRQVEQCGANVIGPVATLDEARSLAWANPHLDGAVLDINLRGTWVFPLADELAERGVRFIFATGYDARMIPARFAHVGRCEKCADAAEITAAPFAES
ncbi:chemotaxis protein CheY [Rhodopseudomonas sp. AAP120]|nr:chemotaxis protein CheY [Rhodopseudomonas sp. AAP120]